MKTLLAGFIAMMISFSVSMPANAERCIGSYDSAKDFWYDQKLCQ